MIEYKWKIDRIHVIESVNDKENVVKKINFLFEGSRNNKNEFIIDEVDIEFNKDSESFIPFDYLTEEDVLDWVVSAIGDEMISYYKDVISEKLGPENIIEKPLPWTKKDVADSVTDTPIDG